MQELAIFQNEQFGEVRVIMIENEPWFVAKDVAKALEYPESSLNQLGNLFRNVPEEWKGHNRINTPGGVQEMLTLSEQGLYFFLGRSDKPKALPYQKFIAGEVMPSIRKTGSYSVEKSKPQKKEPVFETLKVKKESVAEMLKVTKMILRAAGIKGERLALGLNNAAINLSGINHLAISGENLISETKEPLMTATQIGGALNGISARAVNQILLAEGFQKKEGKVWRLTDKGKKYGEVVDTGKAHGGSPISHIKWRASVLEAISHH